MIALSAWILFIFQAAAMAVDEFHFHRRRGLPRWERIGHPIDTITVLACFSWAWLRPLGQSSVLVLAGLSVFSMLFITKDEFVHAKHCQPAEHWLHALQFILHPLCLGVIWLTWPLLHDQPAWLGIPLGGVFPLKLAFFWQFSATALFFLYQMRSREPTQQVARSFTSINNDCYHQFGIRWYQADDHPVALLRAESKLKTPWILSHLERRLPVRSCAILDIGCGGGFLSNALAEKGHQVCGVDLSEESLEVARAHDSTGLARYLRADAAKLPFGNEEFDAVCLMDFLEHVDDVQGIIAEASRVLRKDGLVFFHTFNRNPLSWFVVIKLTEWFVANTPKNLHIYRLFIKPSELKEACETHGLRFVELLGSGPNVARRSFWKVALTGKIPPDFEFRFTRSTAIGYSGVAMKISQPSEESSAL